MIIIVTQNKRTILNFENVIDVTLEEAKTIEKVHIDCNVKDGRKIRLASYDYKTGHGKEVFTKFVDFIASCSENQQNSLFEFEQDENTDF